MERKNTGLTPLQELFIEEYLIDFDAGAAVKRAGYTVKHPVQYGSKLMQNPNVQAGITRAKEERKKRVQISSDKVLQETAKLAFTDIRKLFKPGDFELIPPCDLPDEVAPAVASVKKKVLMDGSTVWEYTFYDKTKALEKLFRHLGLYNDQTTLEVGDKLAQLLKVIDGQGVPKPNAGAGSPDSSKSG